SAAVSIPSYYGVNTDTRLHSVLHDALPISGATGHTHGTAVLLTKGNDVPPSPGAAASSPARDGHMHGLDGLRSVDVTVACGRARSEEHTTELQSRFGLVCRLLLEQRMDEGE